MSSSDLALISHLMRRAGFGATRSDLEDLASKGYAEIVDDLLAPERFPDIEDDVVRRYTAVAPPGLAGSNAYWVYRMINSNRPLEEKMALFWHQVFATSWPKAAHPPSSYAQIDTFRRNGLSDLRTILIDLSRDPSMIYWLDNNENRDGDPNENYGRELLELFSMGEGNYTEEDVKMAAHAFTGWTFTQPISHHPYNVYPSEFEYLEEDHDDGEKTFLGETGRFNGEDIIDIIVRQPATPRFVARHLYNFFVADEPPVPTWNRIPPQDPDTVDAVVEAYSSSGGQMRPVLRTLFNLDSFKEARFRKIKSPVELMSGIIKLVGTHRFPDPDFGKLNGSMNMGQQLFNPPTVEGWHTGMEWIDSGALNERVNFAVDEVSDVTKPGVQDIIARLRSAGRPLSPEELVDKCLDLIGPIDVANATRDALIARAEAQDPLRFEPGSKEESAARVVEMLQLIVSSAEYQFA